MPTPEDKKRAKARKATERAAEKVARKIDREARRKAKRIAKKAAKSYRQVSADKAYCTNCHRWYNPRNRRQNRKHDHLG